MVDITITALPEVTSLAGSEVVALDQGVTTKKATLVQLGYTITPKSFGAVGDGVTDDTAALQAAIDYAYSIRWNATETWNSVSGGTSSAIPSVNLGALRYKTGPLTINPYCHLKGDNAALVFSGTSAQDLITGDGSYQLLIDGVDFVGGRHALSLSNTNLDRTRWSIYNCEFRLQSAYAILTEAKGGTHHHLSAVLTIKNCLFDRAAQVINNCCDTCIIEDCWVLISTINTVPSEPIFNNRADDGNFAHDYGFPRLILRNMFGVPDVGSFGNVNVTITIDTPAVVTWATHGLAAGSPIVFSTTGALPTGITAGTIYYVIATGLTVNAFQFSTSRGGVAVNTSGSQSGVQSVEDRPANLRWIDNYRGQVIANGCRFGGEDGGMPIVTQQAGPITSTPFLPATAVVITDSWIYCGTSTDPNSGVICLLGNHIPQQIVIRNCTGPGSGRFIANPNPLDIATYMSDWASASGQAAVDYFYVNIEGTSDVSGVAVIPDAMLPYLVNRNAGKCWAYVTISGGAPTLVASYNITSISDNGVGQLGVAIRTDFPDANWAAFVSGKTTGSSADSFSYTDKAAGSITCFAADSAGSVQDPISYDFIGMGYGGGMSHGH